VPGNGLAEKWDIHEIDSRAAVHLGQSGGMQGVGNLNPDVIKALEDSKQSEGTQALGGETASVGGAHLAGSGYYPIQLTTGEILAGADTFAELTNGAWKPVAHYGKQTVIATRQLEKGSIFYCGTNLGAALKSSPEGSKALLDQVLDQAQVTAPQLVSADPGVEFDILYHNDTPAFIVLNNCGSAEATVNLDEAHTWTGLFSGKTISASAPGQLTANETDLFVRDLKE
jgi:hypothetical protein